MHKINGIYYIVNNAAGTGVEYVMQSTNYLGPYISATLSNAPEIFIAGVGTHHQVVSLKSLTKSCTKWYFPIRTLNAEFLFPHR